MDPFGTPWLCTADRVRICNHSMLAVFRSGAVCLAVLLAVFASAASIQLTSGSLTVYASKTFDGSDVSSARRSTVPLAGSLEQVLKLENNFYLNARLVIQEDANPKQVFLRLHKPDTNIEAIFAFKKESRAGTFSLQLVCYRISVLCNLCFS